MKKILLLGMIVFTVLSYGQEVQEIYQKAKIYYNNSSDLQRLDALGIPIEHGVHKKGHFFISDFSISELDRVRNAGFNIEVLIEDSAAYFLQKNKLQPYLQRNPTCNGGGAIDYQTPANFNLGSMGGYLTYQELLDELDEMRMLYPNLITAPENISTFLTEGTPDNTVTPSIGGNGIKWLKISDNPGSTSEGEPQILYTAIHHAREPMSLSQLVFYMWYLLENYDTDPEVQSIVDNTELYFVPVVNPDGYLYNQKTNPNGGGFWRKNRKNTYGTDLNRNYDYYINGDPGNGIWGGLGTSNNTGSNVYHGPSPFSEIETQAMKWFVENHDFVMAFNNHSYSKLLLYPYGYDENVPTPENALFQGISEELVSQNGYANIISSELYPAAGVSDDFMYGTVNTHTKIYAFTPEIGAEFWPNSNQIEPIAKEMMYLNITSAKMVNNYAGASDTSPQFVGDQAVINANFDIRRLGVAGSGDFTVSLSPVSTNIVATGSPAAFSGLEVLDVESGTIQYTLAGGTAAGDDIIYDLIVNNGSYDTAFRVNKKFGNLIPIFTDPGDSTSDNFNNNGWDVTTSTFVSPSSSITDSASGNYPNNANETITLSDEIDLTTAIGANVTFWAKWEIENNFDYVQFEVSINGGSNWTAQCGKYTNEGSTNNSQPTGEPLYDGFKTDWVLEEIDLSDYIGENILVRFHLSADDGVREDGFYFDDLTINIVEDYVLGDADISEVQFSIYPNPVKNLLNITTLFSNYSMEVYTLQGQLISLVEDLSGSQTINYSGYATGLYILKLTSEGTSQTFKIVKQ